MRSRSGSSGSPKQETTAVDVRAVRRWLGARRADKGCPVCHRSDLRVGKDFFFMPGVHTTTGTGDLESGSKLVRVRCGHCAHVMFFHARQMGVAD